MGVCVVIDHIALYAEPAVLGEVDGLAAGGVGIPGPWQVSPAARCTSGAMSEHTHVICTK
jgi:hypothetical protein